MDDARSGPPWRTPRATCAREYRRAAPRERSTDVRSSAIRGAIVLLVALASIATSARAVERTGAIGGGTLQLGTSDASGVAALLLDTELELDVEGLLAELTLTQRFRNTTDEWLDGTYLFPLPADAAVRGLELRVGERTVVGEVRERERARATFERARADGRIAAVVEQERPNLFVARVASVAPGAEVRVRLDVLLPVAASDERLSLTLPTTLTPRYANRHAERPAALDAPFLPPAAVRGPRMTLVARVRPLADPSLVESDTHALRIENGALWIRDAPMDRDVTIAWPFSAGVVPRGTAFVATHAGNRYVQLFMAPPTATAIAPATSPPRELTLVVDVSGSMAGLSIDAARAAALTAIDGLGPRDRLDLIAFDDRTRALFDGPRAASPTNLDAARRFLVALDADGGTEMAPALARALRPPARAASRVDRPLGHARGDARGPRAGTPSIPGGDVDADVAANAPLRQIVFLTDGSIADESRLLAMIERDVGDARLFTVGIGSAPNRWFLEEAAELGRGRALAIADLDEVRPAVTALFGRLERPVLTDLDVEFPGARAEIQPTPLPDLYADEPLTLVARLEGEATEAIVRGRRGDEEFRRTIALPAADDDGTGRLAPALAMRWARTRVDALLADERRARSPERHRDAIVRLALETGLTSPYTSFVAVERTPSRPANEPSARVGVANLLPAGSDTVAISMPRGAAGVDTLAAIAALCAALAPALAALSRRVGRRDPLAPRGRVVGAAGR